MKFLLNIIFLNVFGLFVIGCGDLSNANSDQAVPPQNSSGMQEPASMAYLDVDKIFILINDCTKTIITYNNEEIYCEDTTVVKAHCGENIIELTKLSGGAISSYTFIYESSECYPNKD